MRGFLTLELLISSVIISACTISALSILLSLPTTQRDGMIRSTAITHAQEQIESALIEGEDEYWRVVSSATSTTNGISTSLHVTTAPDGLTKYLSSYSSWVDTHAHSRTIKVEASLTNLTQDATMPLCTSLSTTNWTESYTRTYSLSSAGILPLYSASFPIATEGIIGTTLIMGASSTASKADPTLALFDISSTTNPQFISQIDTTPSTRIGVAGITGTGNMLYVANAVSPNYSTCTSSSACAQLQVLSIADVSHPQILSMFQLATATMPYAIGTGGQSSGKSIVYANGFIYLGITKTASPVGDEFNIIDVHSSTTPLWLGGFHVGRTVQKIALSGIYAFLATDNPQGEIIVLDIEDPTHITQVSTYDAPGNSLYGYGRDIAIATSSSVVLGRSYAPGSSELLFFRRDTGENLHLVASGLLASSSNPISVEGIVSDGMRIAAVTTVDLELWDVDTHASSTEYNMLFQFPSTQIGTSLTCKADTLFVGSIDATRTGFLTISKGT